MTPGALENNLSELSICFLRDGHKLAPLQCHCCQILNLLQVLLTFCLRDYIFPAGKCICGVDIERIIYQTFTAILFQMPPGVTLLLLPWISAFAVLQVHHHFVPCTFFFGDLLMLPPVTFYFLGRNIENRTYLGRSSLEIVLLMIISYLQPFFCDLARNRL